MMEQVGGILQASRSIGLSTYFVFISEQFISLESLMLMLCCKSAVLKTCFAESAIH